jgi:hypothetical protein
VAAPARQRSRRPAGVSTVSNATLPTTVIAMYLSLSYISNELAPAKVAYQL